MKCVQSHERPNCVLSCSLSLSLSNPSPHFEQTQPSKTTVSISHLLRLLETQMVPMMSGLPFSAWLVWIPHSLVPRTFSRLCPCCLCPHGASAQSHTLPSCPLSKAVFAPSSWNYHCILQTLLLGRGAELDQLWFLSSFEKLTGLPPPPNF